MYYTLTMCARAVREAGSGSENITLDYFDEEEGLERGG